MIEQKENLEIKMENITKISNINRMKSLKYLSLSMNKIVDISQLANIKNLIYLNLA